jgi:hypothetical protein
MEEAVIALPATVIALASAPRSGAAERSTSRCPPTPKIARQPGSSFADLDRRRLVNYFRDVRRQACPDDADEAG